MMSQDDIAEARRSSQSWYWWGIATFFRCPVAETPADVDIGLVGVPHSSGNGSTERDQHLGPRAVRNVSGYYRRSHGVHGFSPWDAAKISDLGDVPLPEAMNNEACVRDIEAFYARLDAAGTKPVSIGGDHSITGPIIKAIAGPGRRLSGGQPCSLIHFDAHTDSYDNMPHWLGAKRSAAHWAAYTAKEGAVDPERSIQIGMRGHPAADIHTGGVGGDLDSLDPSVAPGVSNLEPGFGGLTIREATRLLQGLKGLNIIGGDVVCLMTTKDSPNQITAQVAMVMMYELICLIAAKNAETH
jgi:guanidinopropionase